MTTAEGLYCYNNMGENSRGGRTGKERRGRRGGIPILTKLSQKIVTIKKDIRFQFRNQARSSWFKPHKLVIWKSSFSGIRSGHL